MQDGFLNRFLIFLAAPRGEYQEVSEEMSVVPDLYCDVAACTGAATAAAAASSRASRNLEGILDGMFDVYTPGLRPAALESMVRRLPWDADTVKLRVASYGTLREPQKGRCRRGNRDFEAGRRRQPGTRNPETAGVLETLQTQAASLAADRK